MVTNGQTTEEATTISIEFITISLIDRSPLNRLSDDTDADIAELAQTIENGSLLSPISVRPREGGRYEIIYGERRWRAYRLLARKTIPCIVKDLDDTQAQIERVVENFQRRELSFMEQGEAVLALMKLTDKDVSEIANRLGQSISWVRRRAKLPNLIPAWRDALAKDDTPYYSIRDSVNRMEELAVLPPTTQQTILDSKSLRNIKTTKEMRGIIARLFMSLEAKPWTREWEKKTYSGSGKKRCDACMKRSDRENALFVDPDDPNTGKAMCLDPECWKSKSLSWCKSLISENPGIVPIWQNYSYGTDSLTEFFGVKPIGFCNWKERGETETREGYAAAIGVVVDGSEIGTTKPVWIPEPDGEDGDVSAIHTWQRSNTDKYQERQALARLMATDITDYLADIDTNSTLPAVQLAGNKLRATAWFGISGYAYSEEEDTRPDDPDWNPFAWAWGQTIEEIARYVAHAIASDTAQLYNGDRDNAADAANTAALVRMFEIPTDMIAIKASEELYRMTHGQDADIRDGANDMDNVPMEDSPEPAEGVSAIDIEALTDPEDTIMIDSGSYLPMLANAQ